MGQTPETWAEDHGVEYYGYRWRPIRIESAAFVGAKVGLLRRKGRKCGTTEKNNNRDSPRATRPHFQRISPPFWNRTQS